MNDNGKSGETGNGAADAERRIAVALHYEAGTRQAPRVVAKGHGLVADRIVELAEAHDVVIETSPELARALGQLELDESIPIELYEAVAEVIGFVLRTGARSKGD